jgi:hypothetical protein
MGAVSGRKTSSALYSARSAGAFICVPTGSLGVMAMQSCSSQSSLGGRRKQALRMRHVSLPGRSMPATKLGMTKISDQFFARMLKALQLALWYPRHTVMISSFGDCNLLPIEALAIPLSDQTGA